MVNWKRPETVPFPSVWRNFERKNADGATLKYWVQDLTPEYEDIFLTTVIRNFLNDEILCKYSKLCEDPQAVKEFTDFWKEAVKHKLALICLTKDKNGKINVVGGNMTCLSEKGENYDIGGYSEIFKKVFSAVDYVTKYKNLFNELNINEYLTAYGLYVFPKYRGQSIGTEILRARRELSSAVGIKASGTIFTSIISQKNAKKAGFQEFVEIDYDDLEKTNPDWRFPGITSHTKSIKLIRALSLAVDIKASGTIFTSIISQRTAKKAGFQEFVEIDYDDSEKKIQIGAFLELLPTQNI